MVAGEIRTERLVFVDECSTNTSLAPLYAWSRGGERAFCSLPRNWGANITLLASMSMGGMGPCLAVEGPTYHTGGLRDLPGAGVGALAEAGASGCDGQPLFTQGRGVKELIEERGCKPVYLPPYSPDLNPIEEAFAKLKALLRKTGARTHEALIEAMGRALEAVTEKNARGFFEHRGYRGAAAQLL
jgi:hypothetical protein